MFGQSFNHLNGYEESSPHPRPNFHRIHQREFSHYPTNSGFNRGFVLNDTGICDVMSNCHLTKSLTSSYIQPINVPITQISLDNLILSSYVPVRRPLNVELQTTANGFFRETHQTIHPTTSTSTDVYHPILWESESFIHHNQQHLQGLRFSNFNCQNLLSQSGFIQPTSTFLGSGQNQYTDETTTSIKFHDRNQKVDFKANFRDENRRADGCFHNEERKEPEESASMSNVALPPPKKKWIRNYMTGKV